MLDVLARLRVSACRRMHEPESHCDSSILHSVPTKFDKKNFRILTRGRQKRLVAFHRCRRQNQCTCALLALPRHLLGWASARNVVNGTPS
jgi:hypothetical protein